MTNRHSRRGAERDRQGLMEPGRLEAIPGSVLGLVRVGGGSRNFMDLLHGRGRLGSGSGKALVEYDRGYPAASGWNACAGVCLHQSASDDPGEPQRMGDSQKSAAVLMLGFATLRRLGTEHPTDREQRQA